MALDQINPTKFSLCFKGFLGIITAFFFCVFIICPFIIESIVLSEQNSLSDKQLTLLICSSIQTLISMWGGYKLGILARRLNSYDEFTECNKFWCTSITNIGSLLSGGYVIYSLPSWIVTNMIASWVISSKNVFPWYVHLMIYMPLIVYVPFFGVGYATHKAIDDCDLKI